MNTASLYIRIERSNNHLYKIKNTAKMYTEEKKMISLQK